MENELQSTCEELKKALKEKGDVLINFVVSRNRKERVEIKNAYKTFFGKDLKDEINHALNGNFRRVIIDLFRSPEQRDAIYLYKAMKGAGTDEETIIEIICSRPNRELIKIKEEYKNLYNEDLEKKVASDTSGNLKKILTSLLQCQRSENATPVESECRKTAEKLYKAGEGKLGTDEVTFNKVFALSSPAELFSINTYYSQFGTRTLREAVAKEFSGGIKHALNTILEAHISPTNYYARKINKSVKGIGTNDKMLIRNICGRADIDMKEIRLCYQSLFEKDMIADIKGDTSGDYQKILVALASKD
jgi:annexin A7/11